MQIHQVGNHFIAVVNGVYVCRYTRRELEQAIKEASK